MQKELDQRGYRYHVVNAGISGDTTTDGLERIRTVTALKPAMAILEFGGNDGLRGLPVSTTRANLEQMILALQKAGAKIVLAGMTLPPNYGPEYIRSFEGVYHDLAKQYQLPLIPFLLLGVGGNPALMQRDGIHPTGRRQPHRGEKRDAGFGAAALAQGRLTKLLSPAEPQANSPLAGCDGSGRLSKCGPRSVGFLTHGQRIYIPVVVFFDRVAVESPSW